MSDFDQNIKPSQLGFDLLASTVRNLDSGDGVRMWLAPFQFLKIYGIMPVIFDVASPSLFLYVMWRSLFSHMMPSTLSVSLSFQATHRLVFRKAPTPIPILHPHRSTRE